MILERILKATSKGHDVLHSYYEEFYFQVIDVWSVQSLTTDISEVLWSRAKRMVKVRHFESIKRILW